MRDIRLLDCTLRDGGYVNDWEFGHHNIVSIFERLVDSNIDIVEIGFIDDRRPFDINRSIIPGTKAIESIYGNIKKRPSQVFGMIDYGTCSLEHVQPCSESYLDGIRVIFKKHIMHEALNYCSELIKLGYKVCAQLVSITSYNDEELDELIEHANRVKPYAVGIVDTYGLLDPQHTLHYYEQLDAGLDESISIGFHGHNNFQLAYANSRAFLDRKTDRNIIVDGTLFGMGKSAGNAPVELVGMYLNQSFGKNYNINSMLEAIDESVMDFYKKTPWGYKMYFYLSAYNGVHPNYVGQMQGKPSLSITEVNNLLGHIGPGDTKLLYDKAVAEKLYSDFEKSELDDNDIYKQFSNEMKGRNILVVGPGKNIQLQADKVSSYISDKKPLIISINYIPGAITSDYVFVTNSNRYRDMADDLLEVKNAQTKVIGTSNVEARNGEFAFTFTRESLLEKNEEIIDNSFLMLLKIFEKAGVKKISCAGLDGYSDKEDNYFNPRMEYSFIKGEARHLNRHIREVLAEMEPKMEIEFITYSHYMDKEDSHDAAF
ncbi:MAG: 3-hydroxy-3-methylglutaryl-CoA lyase [Lachnospiraceae bacterium]|jgi:4-hydroxy 2-oxovalerate aldolase|nr:3-hydroxy-3-methylglutaryl-CoA lyase [Lachnospiraceae bacterium]